ncbi:MAG: ATP-binding protein [Desulfobacteraceae bacterium]|nr:ATP-binding protein [Desulfobacteraceae bacterium]
MKQSFIRIGLLGLSILGISLLHYLTPLHLHYLHDIFQRFYYLPIILAALWFGFRGGLTCSLLVSIVYAPHILFQWGGQLTVEMEKYLEIVMYNIVGSVTGLLAQRERERSLELQRTAEGLEESCNKLQAQSERIIAIEEQLRRSEKLSTLGEMAAVLAHEIRNPLGSIRGTAEILRDDYRPGDPKHEFIEIQIKETERLNHVVEDFLRMARQQPVELRDCSLREELETIMTLVSRDAHERGVALSLEAGTDPAMIRGDGEKLRQAFLNIILNALQATPTSGSVEIVLDRDETGFGIHFRDNGSGIAADNLQRIFEPFYTTKTDGTGLGLAVTRKIIEAHDGKMDIESKPGQGTTVSIHLPLPTGGTES